MSNDLRQRSRLRNRLYRTPIRRLHISRVLRGGSLTDFSRIPRYLLILILSLTVIWALVGAYVKLTPKSYKSTFSLILPGAGAAASINRSDIGQASSTAASPYSGSTISPTVTYKRLLTANRVLSAAADQLSISVADLGKPKIQLVDETSLIQIEMTARTPEDAQKRSAAILQSFLAELDRLRQDEIERRAEGVQAPIAEYEKGVQRIRTKISKLQSETGLDSSDQYDALVAEVIKLRTQVRTTRAALDNTADQAKALTAALNISPKLAALTLKLHADTEFQELTKTVSRYSSDLSIATGKFGDRHPTVVVAKASLAGATDRLYARASLVTGLDRNAVNEKIDLSPEGERGALLAELVNTTAKRDGLASELTSLSASLREYEAEVQRLASVAAALDDLKRDYKVAEAVFASALARTDTTKTDIYASYPLAQILEDASYSPNPSSPNTLVAIAGGVGSTMCVIIAIALAWIRRPLIDKLANAIR